MGRPHMKTILVPTEQNAGMESALDCALLLAKKFDSWIEGFALRPAVADMVAMDPDAGLTMVAVKENDADMARQAEDLFRSFMERHGVQRQAAGITAPPAAISWTWHADAPSGHDFRRQLWPRVRRGRAGPARRGMAEPVDGNARIRLVRKRTSGADRAADLARFARHAHPDRLEPLDRAGAVPRRSLCRSFASPSASPS